ncbi:MAG TPA: hypothetical protein VGE63_01255 [Candidatus Paceibacterota bacterium]
MKKYTNIIILLSIIIIGLVVYIIANNRKSVDVDTMTTSEEMVTTPVGEQSTTTTSSTPVKKTTTSTPKKTTTATTSPTPSINKTLLENNPYVPYGFYIQTPTGYRLRPSTDSVTGNVTVGYPDGVIMYVKDAAKYEQSTVVPKYKYLGTTKVGGNTFKTYTYGTMTYYWITDGNEGYEIITTKKDSLSTFEILE